MRERLREIRLKKGLTQEELARKIGIDRSTYTNIELGYKNPSLKVALKIKEELDYRDDNIFLKQ